ncbi:MAG: GNAT family N-acetyltransferase [Bacteroidia bacterium]|nr:GNAT family N-acetyltransferase [Bacteroidia bacterium]
MVTYRIAEDSDYVKINEFHNRIYGKQRTMEQFLWEFHDAPYGKAIYVIAEDQGKIVGTNCLIPIYVTSLSGEKVLTAKSEDTLVDPAYRGQNIFDNIYNVLFEEASDRGIKFIWGYTSAIKPFRKIGFDTPFSHKQALMVNRILPAFLYLSSLNKKNRLSDRFKIFFLCVYSKLLSIPLQYGKVQMDFIVEETNKAHPKTDELIIQSAQHHPDLFFIFQNQKFQQWRIYENPYYYKLHTFSFYDQKNNLVALIILNTHPNGTAYIIQTTFHSCLNEKQKIKFLSYVVKKMFSNGTTLIRNWVFDTNELNKNELFIFKKTGFVILNRGISFVWKALGKDTLSPENFYLSRISTEGVI